MTGSHRALKAHLTLALCFPYADLPAIRSLRADLSGEHIHLELAPGVDRDLEDVRVFLSSDTPTVLVLVRSANLSESRSGEVMALFARCRSANHRLAVVEFDADEPRAFVEAVADAAASFKARPVPSAQASTTIGVMRSESRRRPTPIGVDGRPCLPAAELGSDDEPSLGTSDSFRDIVGPIPEGVCDALTRSDEFEPTERVAALLDTNADGPDTIPAMRVTAAREAVSVRPQRRWGAMLAGVAIAAAVSAGVAFKLRAAPQAGGTAQAGLARTASLAPQSGSAGTTAFRPADDDAEAAVPTRVAPSEPVATSRSLGSVEAHEQARVVTALLDAGKIHALDGLLARRASRMTVSQAEAARRCARYSIGGLDGWRLASLDELRALRRARLLPAGVFWSSTKRTDRAFAMSRDATRPLELDREEAAAASFCVRSR